MTSVNDLEAEKTKLIALFHAELAKLASGETVSAELLDLYHSAISHTSSIVKQMAKKEPKRDVAAEALANMRKEL
jgi:hypothetical protein